MVAFVSVSRDEATQRLRTIKAILDSVGVTWHPINDGVELDSRPIVFKTFACTVGSVSGFTSILVVADEVAKWRDRDSSSNPATEVLAALRPTMATQPDGRIILSSSAVGLEDAHAKAFDQGETSHQCIALAASWEANPTLTQASTRRDEPHEPTWKREYASIPLAGASGAFLTEDIEAAIRDIGGLRQIGKPILVLDSSAGSGDSWTWAVAAWCRPIGIDPDEQWLWEDIGKEHKPGLVASFDGRYMRRIEDERGQPVPNPGYAEKIKPTLVLYGLDAIAGRFRDNVTADEAVARAMTAARRTGVTVCVGDQYQSFFLESACKTHGVKYKQLNWSNTSKITAVTTLRRWLRAKTIAIEPGPEAEALKKELLGFEERLSPSGILTFGARRGGHDDRVALLINAAMAEASFLLDGSPNGRSRRRHELHDYNPDYESDA